MMMSAEKVRIVAQEGLFDQGRQAASTARRGRADRGRAMPS